jgi:PAS domain S-box-containing protein
MADEIKALKKRIAELEKLEDTYKRAAEDRLKESEEKYRFLIENAGETIVVAQDERVKFINGNSFDLLGYRPEELVGKPFIDFIHKDDRKLVGERYARRLKGEEPSNKYSFRVINRTGEIKWVQISAVRIDWRGKPATLNFLTDITESKLSEIALKASETRYRTLFESSNDILVQIDTSMKLTDINYKAEEISGYKNEELVGKSIGTLADKFTPLSLAAMIANFAKRKLGFQVRPYEVEAFDTHRNKLSFEINAVPIKDGAGKDIGEMAVLHDITERKKAEAKLKESGAKFRSIVENSADQIFMLDKDNRFLLINKTTADLFRRGTQEIIGKTIFEVFPETTAAHFSENIKKVFETGESLSLDEKMVIQGQEFYNSTKLNPVKDDEGNVTAVSGIARDITEHMKAQEEAQKAAAAVLEKKRINELISIMSHELRTPLTPIIVYASLFLTEKYGKLAPKYLETADIIKKESDHLQAIIQDFLDAAHIVGDIPLRFSEKQVPIKPMLDELLLALWAQFEVKGISVEVSLPEGFPLLFVDAEKIRTVFSNLLVNALKFVPKGGWVKVTGEARGKDVLFRVVDNGIGIAPENLQKVFDKFFQVDSTSTRKEGGMGLGLAIAKQFVEMHGGKIWAESDGLGKGSRICFTLPVEEKK